jgi:hypothetical protein
LALCESNHKEGENFCMVALVWTTLLDTLKIIMVGLAVLYAGMVLMAMRTEGLDYRPRWNWNDIARSTEQLVVWGGVRIVARASQAAKSALEVLTEASADLGEWFVHQRGGNVEAKFRSRFL